MISATPSGEKTYPIKVGARAVVTRQNESGDHELLIGQRPETSTLDAGKWSLPGGKPIPTEDMIECVARELLEETGLIAQLAELIHVEHGWYDGALVISFFVHISQWTGEVESHPGQEQWRWCPIDQLPENFMANTQKLLETGILPYILQAEFPHGHQDDDCGDC